MCVGYNGVIPTGEVSLCVFRRMLDGSHNKRKPFARSMT